MWSVWAPKKNKALQDKSGAGRIWSWENWILNVIVTGSLEQSIAIMMIGNGWAAPTSIHIILGDQSSKRQNVRWEKKAVELEFFARLNWWDCFDRNQTQARWSCDSIDIVNVKHKKFDVTKQVEIDRSLVRIHYTTQRTTTRWTTRDSREWRFFLTFSR